MGKGKGMGGRGVVDGAMGKGGVSPPTSGGKGVGLGPANPKAGEAAMSKLKPLNHTKGSMHAGTKGLGPKKHG